MKIVLVFRKSSTFVRRDAEILRKHYPVETLRWNHVSGALRLASACVDADVIYSWFAGPHAALAAYYGDFLGPRTAVMLGGFETARVREIDYGALTNPLLGLFVKASIVHSDSVAAVDPYLVAEMHENLPSVTRSIEVIPTGFDSSAYFPNGPKEPIALTVGDFDESAAVRKGLYTFARAAAARKMRQLKFVCVGPIRSGSIKRNLTELSQGRLEVTGPLSDRELLKYYQRAKIYCQLSRHEGLPNALCEAMLCDCIPVATKHGGIPSAVGDAGAYCTYADVESTVHAIECALELDGARGRSRITKLFPIERRERLLVGWLRKLAG
jgi:glycosyltransferase involved in cell wall biosynthesis